MDAALNWTDRWLATRDRLVSSERFQRWAASFPLTRPFARRRARELFDLCAGFVYSQVLLACVRLDLFGILQVSPLDARALSQRLSLPQDATDRLLAAAASLRLIEQRSDGRYGLGVLGAALVGNPGVVAMIEHHALLYADLRDPVALLRGDRDRTELGRYWAYAGNPDAAALGPEQVAEYSRLMADSQPLVTREILAAWPLHRHRQLLDVGGGDGSFVCAVAAEVPSISLQLFDLPAVADRATSRFATSGLAHRATAVGGDFRRDALPAGADLITLVRVLFDHPDETVLELLAAVRRAIPDDGTLLIAEPMAGTSGAEPMGAAYFGFYLMAMGRGRSRAPADFERLLEQAGFTDVRIVPTPSPLQTGLLVARPRLDDRKAL
ncbi:MAG: methyltransferase [bacterium]|jgi:demethylspheroidene O-methyltransferase